MAVCVLLSCHDIPEGYLFIEDAGYLPDSMVVKMNLDTASVEAPNPIWTQYYDGEWNDWAYKYYTKEEWREFLYSQNIYETILVKGPDYDRDRLDIPWVSTAIQGVEGTNPIIVTITDVISDDGNADKMLQYLTVRSNGMLTVPCRHDIPEGHYKISLHFKGPGYERELRDIFTIIVK